MKCDQCRSALPMKVIHLVKHEECAIICQQDNGTGTFFALRDLDIHVVPNNVLLQALATRQPACCANCCTQCALDTNVGMRPPERPQLPREKVTPLQLDGFRRSITITVYAAATKQPSDLTKT
uniref:Fe-S oxidoreductase n=1 Tax=Ascaris lumbricoides TaxID=6252 RepID=A0A0M3HRV4_ASCLU